jgi:hypothetical protein
VLVDLSEDIYTVLSINSGKPPKPYAKGQYYSWHLQDFPA